MCDKTSMAALMQTNYPQDVSVLVLGRSVSRSKTTALSNVCRLRVFVPGTHGPCVAHSLRLIAAPALEVLVSRLTRTSRVATFIVATVATLTLLSPADVSAQYRAHGGGGHGGGGSHGGGGAYHGGGYHGGGYHGGYYGHGYYRPYYYRPYFYNPFWGYAGWYPYAGWYGGYGFGFGFSWGAGYGYPYGYPYGYYGYGWGYDPAASIRIQATPREAQVYVDGYFVGIVDDYDGFSQRLRLVPGEHELVVVPARVQVRDRTNCSSVRGRATSCTTTCRSSVRANRRQ